METTIKINTDHLTTELLDGIRTMFPHKVVEITVQEADETEYLLSNPALTKEIEARIADHNQSKTPIRVDWKELL
ncbi:MAG: hypothetical protein ABI844_09245 [Saprospiraceae bacterium]